RQGRNLRAGDECVEIQKYRGSDPARQPHLLRPCRRRLDARYSEGPPYRQQPAGRHSLDQLLRCLRCGGPLWRLQDVGHRPRTRGICVGVVYGSKDGDGKAVTNCKKVPQRHKGTKAQRHKGTEEICPYGNGYKSAFMTLFYVFVPLWFVHSPDSAFCLAYVRKNCTFLS